MKLRGLTVVAALALCAALIPVGATSPPRDGKIVADCTGFTITFYGTGFEPPGTGFESRIIGWTVTLTTSAGSFPYTGSTTMKYGDSIDPLWSTSPTRPSVAVTVPWEREVCGTNTIVSGGADPDGMYFDGARVGAFAFNWNQMYPDYGSDVPVVAAVTTSTLVCDCEPPVEDICRTPGFWGTHAGTEKSGSKNITQTVLDDAGGVMVCGQLIDTTVTLRADSAVEGICVSPSGEERLQLARHLTAAALNCVISGDDCSAAALIATCNGVCLGSMEKSISECINELDCFNNGGRLLDSGMCQLGTCNGDGVTACSDDDSCAYLSTLTTVAKCVPFPGNCHDRNLPPEFGTPPYPAGSSKACNDANKSRCSIFGNCP